MLSNVRFWIAHERNNVTCCREVETVASSLLHAFDIVLRYPHKKCLIEIKDENLKEYVYLTNVDKDTKKVSDHNIYALGTIGIDNPNAEYYVGLKLLQAGIVEKETDEPYNLAIKDVIYNNDVTVVLWQDGTKTIVRKDKLDTDDKEKALAMAIAKKAYGNKGSYFDLFKKYCPETSETPEALKENETPEEKTCLKEEKENTESKQAAPEKKPRSALYKLANRLLS